MQSPPPAGSSPVDGAPEAAGLLDGAVRASQVSLTISDPHRPDNPMVWVNPAFCRTTGYSVEESVGRNCRFLQGPDTDQSVVAGIRAAVRAGQPVSATLLNYRKDGTSFWNELSIAPVRDDDGEVTHFVGVQADVTARVEAQLARDRSAEQLAVAAGRLALLADFSAKLSMCQQPKQVMQLVADVLVPQIATWCVLCTTDETGRIALSLVQHERSGDPEVRRIVQDLVNVAPGQVLTDGPLWRVLRGDESHVLIDDYDAVSAQVSGAAPDERTALSRKLGIRSVVVVPLLARTGIVGCVALCADDSRPVFGAFELSLVRDLAARAGLMLENTQLYARQRAAASTLQRSLLPRLPSTPGIEVAVAYIPSADEAAVGGDWYDVFALRGSAGTGAAQGGVGVVVGDVMGHNIDSAARMGKLSTIVRSYAWPGPEPRAVLTAVDELLEGTGTVVLATCLYARLIPTADGMRMCYASAGHPAAIVRRPDGVAEQLDGGRGPMLGVWSLLRDRAKGRHDAVLELPRDSTIVFFTDGLVDAFGVENDTDSGLAAMCRLIGDLPSAACPQDIVNALTAAGRDRTDDVALVAIRIE